LDFKRVNCARLRCKSKNMEDIHKIYLVMWIILVASTKFFLYRIQISLICSPPFFLLSLCKIAFFVASTIHTLFKKKLYKLVLMLSTEEKTNSRFCKQITYMFSLRPIHWCSPNLVLPLKQMSLKKENQQKNTV